jgi:hypothetical protein
MHHAIVYRGENSDLPGPLPYTRYSQMEVYFLTPSFVITLSWHTSVKKVALSTPKSLTTAQQPFQSALCAVASRGDGFVYSEPACRHRPL